MTARLTSIRLDGDTVIMSGFVDGDVPVERACSRPDYDDQMYLSTVRGHLFAWDAAERLFQRLGVEQSHPPDEPAGAAAIFGKWPGDETEEELLRTLREME
jgi:hypothetical protein